MEKVFDYSRIYGTIIRITLILKQNAKLIKKTQNETNQCNAQCDTNVGDFLRENRFSSKIVVGQLVDSWTDLGFVKGRGDGVRCHTCFVSVCGHVMTCVIGGGPEARTLHQQHYFVNVCCIFILFF